MLRTMFLETSHHVTSHQKNNAKAPRKIYILNSWNMHFVLSYKLTNNGQKKETNATSAKMIDKMILFKSRIL